MITIPISIKDSLNNITLAKARVDEILVQNIPVETPASVILCNDQGRVSYYGYIAKGLLDDGKPCWEIIVFSHSRDETSDFRFNYKTELSGGDTILLLENAEV